MTNVLYISYDGMTDPLGQSQVLPYLMHLSKSYQFHLISFEKPKRYKEHRGEIEAFCLKYNIIWHPLSYTKKPVIVSTIYDIFRMYRKVLKLDRKYKFELIHCRSYVSSFVGLYFKKHYGKKFIFDMRGFWVDERVDGGIWDLKKFIYRKIFGYFKQKEHEFLSYADYVISLTQTGKQEILSKKIPSLNPDRIVVIPCCVNLNLFQNQNVDEIQLSKLKKSLQIQDEDFVLGYIGSIGTWYMLPEMLDFFSVLVKEKPNSKFVFVTNDDSNVIISLVKIKRIDIQKIIITNCVHSEAPTFISLFDYSIFFIKPLYSKKASSPTKQGELMAMGIPVICNFGVGDTDSIVLKSESGIVVESFNEKSYLDTVHQIEKMTFNKERMKLSTEEIFGLEKGVYSYSKIYQALIQQHE